MKYKQPCSGFELGLLVPFPMIVSMLNALGLMYVGVYMVIVFDCMYDESV